MAALLPEGTDGFHGLYDAKILEAGFRAGMPRLTDAADGVLDAAIVAEVCEGAWDRHRDFDARGLDGFAEVELLGARVNSWSWADAMLYAASFREDLYSLRVEQAYGHARSNFPRLRQHGWNDAVNRAFARLCLLWLDVEGTHVRLPGWAVRPVMRQYVQWSLLDVAAELDRPLIVNGPRTCSIEEVFETGEREVRSIGGYDADEAGLGVETAVWHLASRSLSAQSTAAVAAARKGTSRVKADLTYRAATRTLERGAESEEVRVVYDQDPMLCCYESLHEVAVGTWSRYPADKVPTRQVLARVAAETATERHQNAAWFQSVEARRKDLNESGRLLHDINDLVRGTLATVDVRR